MRGRLAREYKGRFQVYNPEGAKWVWRYAERHDCPLCGVEFLHPIRFKGKRQNGTYCSSKCRDKANARRYNGQRPRKNCIICGKQFVVPKPSKADKYATCGRPCRIEYQKQRKAAYWAERRAQS